mmetsp:Transcript_23308/g.53626  ORF Transcript_23308/g.53626 Transcript_23308/m.53626 type:complete len:469 (-) Transcript_23308:112-1518(-)
MSLRRRDFVDTHAADVQSLSASAKEALTSQKPLGPEGEKDAPLPPAAHVSGVALNGSKFGAATDMQFRLEWHGFQCLVHSSFARQAAPLPGDVTWVTQMTADRVTSLEQMLVRWKGPVSVALYSQNVESDIAVVAHLFDKVDFHIVGASQGLYPVNTLRNVAINNARTDFVFLADVDFVPDIQAYEGMKAHVAKLKAQGKEHDKAVWVLPAFEIDGTDQAVPLDFDALIKMGSRIHQVHNDGGREIAHKYSKYDKWRTASEPYVADYKFPYEPYILAPRSIPRFDVRFFGYGNDKASHNYELNAAGFVFHVLPKHFVVHVRHRQGSWVHQTFLDPKERLSRTLTTFLKDVDRRYSTKVFKDDAKSFPALAPSANFKILGGALKQSCVAVCAAAGLTCHEEWAERVNSCKVLEASFACLQGCNDNFFGVDLPAYNSQREQCLINNAPAAHPFSCQITYDFSRRLCPCGA